MPLSVQSLTPGMITNSLQHAAKIGCGAVGRVRSPVSAALADHLPSWTFSPEFLSRDFRRYRPLSMSSIYKPSFPYCISVLLTSDVMPSSKAVASSSAEAALDNADRSTDVEKKVVWLWTKNKQVMTAAVEAGWDTFLFNGDDFQEQELANDWTSMSRIKPFYIGGNVIEDKASGSVVATYRQIQSSSDLADLISQAGEWQVVVMDSQDWQVIPAENVVAAFQHTKTRIFVTSNTAADARVALEALERGTDGVVLRTEDPADVFVLKEYLRLRNETSSVISLTTATVMSVTAVGLGDRVCVDLCCLLRPGEGLLVGSFARALFVVHSECLHSDYVASRPFRVNAGPVHSYVAAPGGKTAYLSELRTGAEVTVVDWRGWTRTAIVGRAKIESRPLLLIEAQIDDGKGERQSLLLQNAETVRLIGADGQPVSVSELSAGHQVLMAKQDSAARHTGIAVQEYIVEC